MSRRPESDFAEIAVDRLIIESFPNESSVYYRKGDSLRDDERMEHLKSRLKWHVKHSLSLRQKQVILLYLAGKRQCEITEILGVTKQVVNIHKRRAINKLRRLIKE